MFLNPLVYQRHQIWLVICRNKKGVDRKAVRRCCSNQCRRELINDTRVRSKFSLVSVPFEKEFSELTLSKDIGAAAHAHAPGFPTNAARDASHFRSVSGPSVATRQDTELIAYQAEHFTILSSLDRRISHLPVDERAVLRQHFGPIPQYLGEEDGSCSLTTLEVYTASRIVFFRSKSRKCPYGREHSSSILACLNVRCDATSTVGVPHPRSWVRYHACTKAVRTTSKTLISEFSNAPPPTANKSDF